MDQGVGPGDGAEVAAGFGITLPFDVIAADGAVLAREGDSFTPALCETVRRQGEGIAVHRLRLRETRVVDDLRTVIRTPLYRAIFDDPSWIDRLTALVAGLEVPVLVASELERMRNEDLYTYNHVLVTTALTVRMLADLGLREAGVLRGACAALTHDIGKLRVPLEILRKESPLTVQETDILRQHPGVGHLLLQYYLGEDSINARVALHHHERLDGSGYPLHLRLTDRVVRLIAVGDIFDALVSPRPYRKEAFEVRGALELMWADARAGRIDELGCRLLIAYSRASKPDPRALQVSDDLRSAPPEGNHYGDVASGLSTDEDAAGATATGPTWRRRPSRKG